MADAPCDPDCRCGRGRPLDRDKVETALYALLHGFLGISLMLKDPRAVAEAKLQGGQFIALAAAALNKEPAALALELFLALYGDDCAGGLERN